jgi:hypothetical protein
MFNINKSGVLMRLALAKWITRLASANGIRDRDVGKWITRLASANGIPDRIVGKWIIRVASVNGVHVGTPGNDQ